MSCLVSQSLSFLIEAAETRIGNLHPSKEIRNEQLGIHVTCQSRKRVSASGIIT